MNNSPDILSAQSSNEKRAFTYGGLALGVIAAAPAGPLAILISAAVLGVIGRAIDSQR